MNTLSVVCLAHEVIDLSPLVGRDVGGGILSFLNKFLKQRIDLAKRLLAVKRHLHDHLYVTQSISGLILVVAQIFPIQRPETFNSNLQIIALGQTPNKN